MAQATVNIKTWRCPVCRYNQNTDPYNESVQHAPAYFPLIPLGKCVNGWSAPLGTEAWHDQDMVVATEAEEMAQTSVVDADELAEVRVVDTDADGFPLMVKADETRFVLDPVTGSVNQVDVMVEKLRPLTDEEMATRLQLAQEEVDNLQEFDPR